ncbi:MAG: hypothetical protein E7536_09105 [Ruminococcaceae bacterium]|nr:hypothetical protein [Oscillospiraceae bacterium]
MKKLTNEDIEVIGENVVKHKRPKRSENMSVQTEPGDNTKYINNALRLADLPPIDTKNISQLQERIAEYFNICSEEDMKPSVAGLALAVGVSRKTIWEWSQGDDTEKSDRRNAIKKAYQILNLMMEDYMQNGKINPVSGIFLMKNNFGYADKQEVVVTPNQPLGEGQETEEIRQRYLESAVTDDENFEN